MTLAGPYPRTMERCNPSVSSACCDGRRLAVRRGEFYWDVEREGWVSVMNPLRTQTCEAARKSGKNTTGEPYLLEICPHCGSALPELFKPPRDMG